jgi:hypothetical protein
MSGSVPQPSKEEVALLILAGWWAPDGEGKCVCPACIADGHIWWSQDGKMARGWRKALYGDQA